MGYFSFKYDSTVVIYERKIFIRLATGHSPHNLVTVGYRCTFVSKRIRKLINIFKRVLGIAY